MSGHTNTEHVFYCLNIYTVFPSVFNIITNYLSALSSKQKIGTKLKKKLIIIIIIIIIIIMIIMKAKNDHRSKFSNLSNWKEEA